MGALELTSYGFAYSHRNAARTDFFLSMPSEEAEELSDRLSSLKGEWVIWDPEDNGQGWMLVGDKIEDLVSETAEAFGITLYGDEK